MVPMRCSGEAAAFDVLFGRSSVTSNSSMPPAGPVFLRRKRRSTEVPGGPRMWRLHSSTLQPAISRQTGLTRLSRMAVSMSLRSMRREAHAAPPGLRGGVVLAILMMSESDRTDSVISHTESVMIIVNSLRREQSRARVFRTGGGAT
eukprot:1385409-Rhodomonas_salina.2